MSALITNITVDHRIVQEIQAAAPNFAWILADNGRTAAVLGKDPAILLNGAPDGEYRLVLGKALSERPRVTVKVVGGPNNATVLDEEIDFSAFIEGQRYMMEAIGEIVDRKTGGNPDPEAGLAIIFNDPECVELVLSRYVNPVKKALAGKVEGSADFYKLIAQKLDPMLAVEVMAQYSALTPEDKKPAGPDPFLSMLGRKLN